MAAVESRLDTQTAIGDHVEGLRCHLRKRLANEEDVRDIAQEACLKMLQAPRPESIGNPKAYLFRIAQHLVYRHYNHHERQRVVDDLDVDALHSGDAGPEGITAGALRRQQVNRAVRELPPKCQTVLRLRWCEGLRVLEIADRTKLSQAMVKKYLATGLAHCRKRLNRYVLADRSCVASARTTASAAVRNGQASKSAVRVNDAAGPLQTADLPGVAGTANRAS